ncbi:MAG TPA: serine/threonine-protein kinase [Gammaproteobacteria bacterium]|nr:serine/threonine-protein kinase [Gammaproteobacteria bacterium]
MRKKFWTSDWFAGLAVSVVFVVLYWMQPPFVESLERTAYDFGVRASTQQPSSQIAVIAIDDNSITNIGRWPWPRNIIAELIDRLAKAGAKVIANMVLYTEPQIDPGLTHINELLALYDSKGLSKSNDATVAELGKKLKTAQEDLDKDKKLADAIGRAGNVVLGMQFIPGQPLGKADKPTPDYIAKNALPDKKVLPGKDDDEPLFASQLFAPIPDIGSKAAAIGHLNQDPDSDGGLRKEPLIFNYFDHYYPSFALAVAARTLNLAPGEIELVKGDHVGIGKLLIKTNPESEMYTFFYKDQGDKPAFKIDSFYDVYYNKIPLENYKDKVVLIGPTAFGVGETFPTPISKGMAPVVVLAHTVSSILNENFFITPSWAPLVQFLILIGVAAYLIAALPRLPAGPAAGATGAFLVLLLAVSFISMKAGGMWLQTMLPSLFLVCGHLLLTTKRFLVAEKGKMKADTESAESNRQLGLSLQQSGQLDMAFERFRRLPMDDSVMELLLNLAGDFERKRQFNKANSVYTTMAQYNKKFRDLEMRMTRAKAMEETVMLGGGGARHPGGTLILADGNVQKPMLGRYQVEKELGKGAMGVVYQGRDPKINRIVAIKTLALQELAADEVETIKSRFYREAETAGRLQHPNIVAIYDVGEEHDLAYIAMEFLKGHDLSRYTKKDNLMAVQLVMGIAYKAALALDYAHSQGVVHRDIKPANIMFDPEGKSIKLTDFGIARITDSSKTKTGMVLGTPSYMSPEQLAGRKIDGRSDLFSLGVMLYQMITGELPFKGESMATLMYNIANEPHQDVFTVRPEISKTKPCLRAIINKALEKDLTKRYQTGAEMARDIQSCAKKAG